MEKWREGKGREGEREREEEYWVEGEEEEAMILTSADNLGKNVHWN